MTSSILSQIHVWIWLMKSLAIFSEVSKTAIASKSKALGVAAISVWEVGMLELEFLASDWVRGSSTAPGEVCYHHSRMPSRVLTCGSLRSG